MVVNSRHHRDFVAWVLCVICLGCSASSPAISPEADPWQHFAERLAEASTLIKAPGTPGDPVTRADGYQVLPRVLRLAWEYAHEYADPERPILFKSTEAYMTNGWQTNDAVYYSAIIDGSQTYRLIGRLGDAPFIELTANEGFDGMQGESVMVASLMEDAFEVDEAGYVDILIGPNVGPRKSLRTTPATNFIFLRQYAHAWEGLKEASLRIERVGGDGLHLRRSQRAPTAPEIQHSLEVTFDYMFRYLKSYHARATGLLKIARNKVIDFNADGPDSGSTMPAGHRFGVAMYDINAQEALVVEFEPEMAPYWAFQTGNFWGETPAYRENFSTSLNDRQVARESDGSVRLFVIQGACPADLANCLSTVGRRVGSLIYRQARQVESFPVFRSRVAKIADLDTHY